MTLKDFGTNKSERTIVELYLAHDKLKKEFGQLKLNYIKLESENRRLTDQLSRVRDVENMTEKFESLDVDQEKTNNMENNFSPRSNQRSQSITKAFSPPWRNNPTTNSETGSFRPRSKTISHMDSNYLANSLASSLTASTSSGRGHHRSSSLIISNPNMDQTLLSPKNKTNNGNGTLNGDGNETESDKL